MAPPDPPASPLPHELLYKELAHKAQAPTIDANAQSAVWSEALVSPQLGRFVLLRALGSGGMGSVFAAYDEQLDRKVALKILHQSESAGGDKPQRVRREAQAMARVSHPNVVHVYDVGEAAGRIFIAMEYIDGSTLTRWQEQEPRSWQQTLSMYRQAGAGLHAAHQTGLVHRDFKPDNVLIDRDGRARVADFGLARIQGDARTASDPAAGEAAASASRAPLTMAGAICGTPGYMSPEQYRGEAVDSRSDQFSFCVALYEALYQRLPFVGSTLAEQAANVLAGRLIPPPAGSTVPTAIYDTLLRGLALDPAERFPSMTELLMALEPDTEPDPTIGRQIRARATRWFFAMCSLSIGLILAWFWRGEITIPALIFIAASVDALAFIFTIALRRSLYAHAFDLRLAQSALIVMTTWLGLRCFALALQLTVRQLLPLEMLVLGGLYGLVGLHSLPKLWLLVLCMWAGGALCFVRPELTVSIFLIVLSAWPVLFLYAWGGAARRRKAALAAEHRRLTESISQSTQQTR